MLRRWRCPRIQSDPQGNSPVQPRSQFPFSTSRKYPGCGWSRVYACHPKPHRGWILNLILSTLSREVNVALLCGRYFEKEASYLPEILPGLLLRLFLNFYEYEILIEKELYLYFTANDTVVIKFYIAIGSHDHQTFDWMNSIKFKASLCQTLDVSNSKRMHPFLCYDFADRKVKAA